MSNDFSMRVAEGIQGLLNDAAVNGYELSEEAAECMATAWCDAYDEEYEKTFKEAKARLLKEAMERNNALPDDEKLSMLQIAEQCKEEAHEEADEAAREAAGEAQGEVAKALV